MGGVGAKVEEMGDGCVTALAKSEVSEQGRNGGRALPLMAR